MKRKTIPLSNHLVSLLQQEPPLAPTGLPSWLAEERKVCRTAAMTRGLPGQGLEAWKYTDVSAINDIPWVFSQSIPDHADPLFTKQQADVLHLTLLNGSYIPVADQALPEGVRIRTLHNPANLDCIKPVLQRTNYRIESIFTVMNRALWHDGLCIQIAANAQASLHIHLVYGGVGHANIASAPRIHLSAGEHSKVDVTISQWSRNLESSFGTACIDLDLAPGSNVTYVHDQQLNVAAYQFTTTRIGLARDAHIHALDVAMGAALSRHDLTLSLLESGSSATLNGIYLLRGRQTTDFHTRIEHRQPYSSSRQVYKGVLDDHAHAVFNGLVEVHPGAMGTDGYQLNRTLLRSPQAVIDTKPELQIHNDDVRCSHGATIGQLDPAELFYLQSRCIPTEQARKILSRAFVVDLIHQQPSEQQQQQLQQAVQAFFNQA